MRIDWDEARCVSPQPLFIHTTITFTFPEIRHLKDHKRKGGLLAVQQLVEPWYSGMGIKILQETMARVRHPDHMIHYYFSSFSLQKKNTKVNNLN